MAQRWMWVAVVLTAAACGKAQSPQEDGARVFALACTRCHGPDGRGGVAGAPTGGTAPRNFADPAFQAARTDDDLRHAVREGKGTAMPPFKAALSAAEIDAVVGHIRSLDPRKR